MLDSNYHSAAAHVLAATMLVPYDCPRSIGEGGRFELLELVSMSPRAWVYRARDNKLSSQTFEAIVAVKISRFPNTVSREALLGRRVDHPAVVKVIDTGETEDGLPFVAMEWLKGRTLACVGHPGIQTSLRWLIEIGRAVQAAHSAGVIHCDLKPQNILIDDRGRPKLTDFDLAISEKSDGMSQRGTLAYMPPEQFCGDGNALTPRTDVYGLGAIAFELFTGSPPHGNDPELVATALTNNKVVDTSILPRKHRAVIARALAPNPFDRYSTAQQFADDIESILNHCPIEWLNPSSFMRLTLWCRRKPVTAVLVFTVVFIAVGCTILWVELSRMEARRDREAGERAQQIASQMNDETQSRVRTAIRLVARGLQARSGEPQLDHVMPALVWTDWLSDSPILPRNGVPPALEERVKMLTDLIDSLEDGSEKRASVAALAARLALVELHLLAGRADQALDCLNVVEAVHLPSTSSDDPVRRAVTALGLCARFQVSSDQIVKAHIIDQLKQLRPTLNHVGVPRKIRERADALIQDD